MLSIVISHRGWVPVIETGFYPVAASRRVFRGWGHKWGAEVFGVLIAATDPVSVIATFKEAKVPSRLRLLIEAESLPDDGTAAVAFVMVLGILGGGREDAWSIAGAMFVTTIGGVLVGVAVAAALMVLAGRTPDYLVEITFTTLAAYGSFLLAEHYHMFGYV